MSNVVLLSTYERRESTFDKMANNLNLIMQALCYCANDEQCPVQELAMALHGEISRAQREERA